MLHKRFIAMLLTGLLALSALGCTAAPAAAPQAQPEAQSAILPTVTVIGEGKLTLTPDMATISLGVESKGKTVEEASEENAQAMEAVKSALKALGLADDQIQTTNYAIYEQYEYDNQLKKSVQTGYNVSNMLEVKVYDMDNAGAVMDAAIAAGATASYGISFGVKDPTARKTELAALAAQDASAQAQAYAAAYGMTVGEPVSISTTGATTNVVYDRPMEEAEAAMADTGATRNSTSSTSFSPGTMELTERVTICFRLEA